MIAIARADPIRFPVREPDLTEVIAAAPRIKSRNARTARQKQLAEIA